MPLEKEEKYMETSKATLKREKNKTSLILHLKDKDYEIILTDDNPNNIKGAFNGLLKELKNGLFRFELNDEKEDLFHNISMEYLTQLNSELKSVFDELKDYNLLKIEKSA